MRKRYDKMVIPCGERRLEYTRYGWMIQRHRKNKVTGEWEWVEDPPAYPATLAQAAEMMLERVLADGADIPLSELPDALQAVVGRIREWFAAARTIGAAADRNIQSHGTG